MSRKLQYFDWNGLAEAIRYMLYHGGLEFEDIRHQMDEWPKMKASFPYGQLPLYEEDGKVLNQSFAIARYVATKVKGLIPSEPWEQAVLDAAALNVYDFLNKLIPYLFEKDPQKKEENKKIVNETVEFFLSRFEKELISGNGHFAGKLSWADFILVGIIEVLNIYLDDKLEKNYPTITALMSKIHSLPGVKDYIAKRAPYKKWW